MAERYARLFSLPENLYMEGAPVVIAAGALLKDNQTGKVLAQLKIRNIQDREIKAATVNVLPLDTAGRTLGGAVAYQYLDISAGRDFDFGQKTPVYLPDNAARSFTVSVTEVIFSDNAVWTAPNGDWTPLNPPAPLETALKDGELVKQYRLTYGADCKYQLQAERDLWRCACGALNRRSERTCHICGKDAVTLAAPDMDALKAARDKRVQEEQQREAERREAERQRAEKERIAREERLAAERADAERRRAAEEARKKKTRKRVMIATPIALVLIATVIVLTQVIIPNRNYAKAEALLNAGQYEEAIAAFETMNSYKDSAARIKEAEYKLAENLLSDGDIVGAIKKFQALREYPDAHERYLTLLKPTIAAGGFHTVGLRSDGTVVAVGRNDDGQCNVDGWTDIVAVATGDFHTVGLRSDGTVVAVGWNVGVVGGWRDIVAVAAGGFHTVGLRSDGTVVAVGGNNYGQCDVDGWRDIVAVAAGGWHTVGLRSNGSAVAVGVQGAGKIFDHGQCKVSEWSDIVAIAAYGERTAAVRADGTVAVIGLLNDNPDVSNWTNVSEWTDIVAVAAGYYHTVGLRSDGTVVAVGENGENSYGQCDVDGWTNIRLPGA